MRTTNDARPTPGEIGTDVTGDTTVEPTEPSTGSATGSVLTVKAAATLLGVSPSLVYALCADGAIRHTRHGRPGKRGCIRIEEAEIERYREICMKQGRRQDDALLALKHITLP